MKKSSSNDELVTSELFDEKTFYKKFISDLQCCRSEVLIESPYISTSRMKKLFPVLAKLVSKGIKISIITRFPIEHSATLGLQAELEIQRFENSGIQVLLCSGNHHRKLAIIDREILWEGSLNILSQTYSREIMRRIYSKKIANDMLKFLNLV